MSDDNILTFFPRDEYELVKWERIAAKIHDAQANDSMTTEMTSNEIYETLSEDSLEVMNRLLLGFKRSGNWTAECNDRMKVVVKELLQLCKILSVRTAQAPVLTKNNTLTIPIGAPYDQNAG